MMSGPFKFWIKTLDKRAARRIKAYLEGEGYEVTYKAPCELIAYTAECEKNALAVLGLRYRYPKGYVNGWTTP